MRSQTRTEWFNACGRKMKDTVKEYDYAFFWWEPSGRAKRAKFGWFEGPYQSLGGVDLGKEFGERRYCLPLIKRRRRSISLDRSAAAKLARALVGKAEDPIVLMKRYDTRRGGTRIKPAAICRLARFMVSR